MSSSTIPIAKNDDPVPERDGAGLVEMLHDRPVGGCELQHENDADFDQRGRRFKRGPPSDGRTVRIANGEEIEDRHGLVVQSRER